MPYDDLYAVTGGKTAGIVIDGSFITESAMQPEGWSELSKDVPLMISTTFAEMAGSMASHNLSALVNNTTDYGIFGGPASITTICPKSI